MTILVVSDIHANMIALEAVIADATSHTSVSSMWVLGDTVGYGAQPNECIERVRVEGALVVAGNHDHAAIGKIDVTAFNEYAAEASIWTSKVLQEENKKYIASMPLIATQYDCTLAHGTPRDPIWEYLVTAEAAVANLDHFETTGCAVGQSHLPFLLSMPQRSMAPVVYETDVVLVIGKHLYFFNPGSVGQPRDNDQRASYVLFDPDACTLEFRRTNYNVQLAQRLIEEAGLPQILADRLKVGH